MDPQTTTHDDTNGGELRPERLGEELRGRAVERLRPERLGALARELPAWRIADDQSLLRTWSWPDAHCASLFARLAAALGDAAGHPPVVRQYGSRVTVRLSSPHAGGLTAADVELARRLGAAG
jgi:pterin-4a-carbinolamine dehydratase